MTIAKNGEFVMEEDDDDDGDVGERVDEADEAGAAPGLTESFGEGEVESRPRI